MQAVGICHAFQATYIHPDRKVADDKGNPSFFSVLFWPCSNCFQKWTPFI